MKKIELNELESINYLIEQRNDVIDISNRLKEIKDEINQLKETKGEDYLLKIDLLDWEYTKLYSKLLSE